MTKSVDVNDLLVCPVDRQPLEITSATAECPEGHSFPVIDEIPVLLPDSIEPTHESAVRETREVVKQGSSLSASLCVKNGVDPYVQDVVAAAGGRLFRNQRGRLSSYPIPRFPADGGNGRLLLDVGCNWGRWSIAAARVGFVPIGIDPSLRAVAAARRVAHQLEMPASYIVGDARCLPFRQNEIDFAFSYSVVQHFSRSDAQSALAECARVLGENAQYLVQMPNRYGLTSLYHQLRRGFRQARGFEVRYWSPADLIETFSTIFGQAELEVDGFWGLGVGAVEPQDVTALYRPVVRMSRLLAKLEPVLPLIKYVADSLYVHGRCAATE